jgi:N6-adenosine-specific RNA methylase IME4
MMAGLYEVIVVDPPWAYGSDTGRPNRTAESHYSTIGFNGREINRRTGAGVEAIIGATPVRTWAAKNCHLYVWVTNPKLPFVFRCIEAWDFTYKTLLTWRKTTTERRVRNGMGWFFRGATEHVAFAVRGRMPIPSGCRKANIFDARPRGHSVKPDEFYDLLDSIYTSGERRIDAFARRRRLGWDAWGHEAPYSSSREGASS